MKTIWKRIAALTLTGAMCVSLFGCGDKKDKESNKLLSDELGFGYTTSYQDMDAELEYLQSTVSAGGKLYLQGAYYSADDPAASGDRLYELDPATGKTTLVPLPKLTEAENTSENIQNIALSPDGSGYWAIINTYSYTPYADGFEDYDPAIEDAAGDDEAPADEEAPTDEATPDGDAAPEDDAGLSAGIQVDLLSNTVPAENADAPADETPAEDTAEAPEATDAEPAEGEAEADPDTAGDTDEVMPISIDPAAEDDQNSYAAKKFDMDGELLQEINLNDVAAESDWFYCQALAQDGDGYLYIVTDEGKVLCYDKDCNRQEDINLDTYYVQSLITLGSGAVLASYYERDGDGGTVVTRLEKGSASEPMRPEGVNETSSLYLYGGDGDSVLISDGTYLYYMNAATGETSKLLSWLDSDINASNISGVAGSEDSLLVVLSNYGYSTGDFTLELGTLTKTPAEELPEKTVLTLGALYLSGPLYSAVVDFNRTNENYRITLVDYSAYNTTDDYTLGSKQLDMDVVSGSGPDLIDLSSGNVDKYLNKGVLANLSDLLKKDETISQEDLIAGPLQGYTKDDKLYGLPYSFGLQTLYGSAKLFGDKTGWTPQEMNEIFSGLDEDVQILAYTTRSSFLSMMLYNNLSSFVDYGKATCSFDSEEFKSLLQATAYLPADPDENGDGMTEAIAYSDGDEMQQLQQGDTLLSTGYISSSYDIRNFLGLYVKENGIIRVGYPVESGNGALLSVYNALAISNKCKEKDGAWEFIKSLLTDDFQKNQWNLPITVSAFDAMLETLKEREYYMEGDEKVYVDSTYYIGDTEYTLDPITDEQAQEFKDYVNGASRVSTSYDEDLMNIITEEAAAFFAGDKTVDEVADLIQNKASIYLGETS